MSLAPARKVRPTIAPILPAHCSRIASLERSGGVAHSRVAQELAGHDVLGARYWRRTERDVPGAEAAVKELTPLVADREKRAKKNGYNISNEKASDLREAEAWLAFAKGKSDEALQELRAAADHQDKNGGESVGIPAREMLADMLSELKRPAEALAEYQTVLKNSPNRFDALLGAARAAQASGDATVAQSFYARLASICSPGADRPELAEAKTFLAQK